MVLHISLSCLDRNQWLTLCEVVPTACDRRNESVARGTTIGGGGAANGDVSCPRQINGARWFHH